MGSWHWMSYSSHDDFKHHTSPKKNKKRTEKKEQLLVFKKTDWESNHIFQWQLKAYRSKWVEATYTNRVLTHTCNIQNRVWLLWTLYPPNPTVTICPQLALSGYCPVSNCCLHKTTVLCVHIYIYTYIFHKISPLYPTISTHIMLFCFANHDVVILMQ